MRNALSLVELCPAQEDENFLAAMFPKIIRDPRRREFLGRLRSDTCRGTAERENARASLARRPQESVAVLLFAGRRIEMQARHCAVRRGRPIRPFIENHLLLAGD